MPINGNESTVVYAHYLAQQYDLPDAEAEQIVRERAVELNTAPTLAVMDAWAREYHRQRFGPPTVTSDEPEADAWDQRVAAETARRTSRPTGNLYGGSADNVVEPPKASLGDAINSRRRMRDAARAKRGF